MFEVRVGAITYGNPYETREEAEKDAEKLNSLMGLTNLWKVEETT